MLHPFPPFAFPPQTHFGKVLPKNKIYQRAAPTKSVRQRFVDQIEQIVWLHKLAPETIKLPATPVVAEIQVFAVALKEVEVHDEVLRTLDRAIQSPILFELQSPLGLKIVAAYKRPGLSSTAQPVVSAYFATDWIPPDTPRRPLPMALDLEGLYAQLLAPLMPHPVWPGESLPQHVARMETIQSKERALAQLESRLRREKQFNRKVELHAQIRDQKQELEGLIR
ncbi:MAG: DUF4391 domain-containing protein [Alphaproteobacteria bacterium CG_4_10_14_0_2_um_filter_63_37]|nr:MAG: hypothetical protein AUJ55_13385 [Proteobacteria bacterium CG1_02_64_396]PJA25608.1 MAG: DUF4391 domain-containing protein [Alphaproteobacteria bacterium CG_4_10_14_0_2_um_filter_63_37]